MDVEVLGRKLVQQLVDDKLEMKMRQRENWIEKTDTYTHIHKSWNRLVWALG